MEKRDRPLPPSGRGSTGTSAENPMEPEFEGDETFCCNMEGQIIAFKTKNPINGAVQWRDSAGKFCKQPTAEEWLDHGTWGKPRWLKKRMTNLGEDMEKCGRLYQSTERTETLHIPIELE